MVDFRRREQPEKMPEEESQDADVKKDADPDELLASQELARLGAPGVLAAIEALPAAAKEDYHADVREDAEQEVVDVVNGSAPCRLGRAVTYYRVPGGRQGLTLAETAAPPGAPE